MQALPNAIQSAGELQQDRKRGQMSFFDVLATGDGDGVRPVEDLPGRGRVARQRKAEIRERSASTSISPAIRWPSTRPSCAAMPHIPSSTL